MVDGPVLGEHDGIDRYTVGQRKGLRLSASPTGVPRYVIELKPQAQQVVVGPKEALQRTTLTASGVNWILDAPLGWQRVTAQIRHRHQPAVARVRALEPGRMEVVFDDPQIAITPGQAVVCYLEDAVVGGGWID